MQERSYILDKVKTEAESFLNIKKKRNNTTFLNYRTTFTYFIYYLEKISSVNEITEKNIEMLVEGFQGTLLNGFNYKTNEAERFVKIKPNGVNTHIRRIKTFLNKCLGLPVELAKLNVNKPKYKSLSKQEVELLADECSNYWSNKEIAIRNETLIRFLFNTAFRINEALTLETDNVYNEGSNYFVKIHEKGKAEGELTEVAISEGTYNLLMNYINNKFVPSDFVFSSVKSSNDGKAKAFNRQNFNKSIIELASYVDNKYKEKGINISKTVENNSSHVFRHSKATYLLNTVKEDVVTVKEVLRHSSIDSTLIYLNPKEEAINQVRINNDI